MCPRSETSRNKASPPTRLARLAVVPELSIDHHPLLTRIIQEVCLCYLLPLSLLYIVIESVISCSNQPGVNLAPPAKTTSSSSASRRPFPPEYRHQALQKGCSNARGGFYLRF